MALVAMIAVPKVTHKKLFLLLLTNLTENLNTLDNTRLLILSRVLLFYHHLDLGYIHFPNDTKQWTPCIVYTYTQIHAIYDCILSKH